MKGIIIFKSKYGSTKQFSEWLKEETGFELYEISDRPKDWQSYGTIILGSSVHNGLLSLGIFLILQFKN